MTCISHPHIARISLQWHDSRCVGPCAPQTVRRETAKGNTGTGKQTPWVLQSSVSPSKSGRPNILCFFLLQGFFLTCNKVLSISDSVLQLNLEVSVYPVIWLIISSLPPPPPPYLCFCSLNMSESVTQLVRECIPWCVFFGNKFYIFCSFMPFSYSEETDVQHQVRRSWYHTAEKGGSCTAQGWCLTKQQSRFR